MKKKAICLFLGTALAGAISVASAAQPLTLSADQMDRVTAGGFGFVIVDLQVFKEKDVFENVFKAVFKTIDVNVAINGYLADAEAGANCFHENCVAETLTITDTRLDTFTSTAFSESLSAGNFSVVPQ